MQNAEKDLKITFLVENNRSLNTLPENADFIVNYIFLDQLLSTLFKVSINGKPEPFALKKWKSSEDGLNWKFHLKDDLSDENGTKLTPSYWCKGIIGNLTRLHNKENMLLLSKLNGWENYIKNNGSFPVKCNDSENIIEMNFIERPEGILEMLTMPILGFWKFDSTEKFVSTGVYKVESLTESEAIIKKNKNNLKTNIDTVTFRIVHPTKTSLITGKQNEIVFPIEENEHLNAILKKHVSTPTQVAFIEINSSSKSFNNPETRKFLYNQIVEYRNNLKLPNDSFIRANSIFFDQQSTFEKHKLQESRFKFEEITIVTTGSIQKNSRNTVNDLTNLLKPYTTSIDVKVIGSDEFPRRSMYERKYDIRVGSVDAGTHADYWVSNMMFCTKQGVSFIDHNNEICNFLAKNRESSASLIGSHINKTLFENATIIPLYYKGQITYLSKNINPKDISTNSPLVRVDNINLND